MAVRFFVPLFAISLLLFSCQQKKSEKYIIYLHNRFLENHSLSEQHPQYGKMEYLEILSSFKNQGFNVIAEIRQGNVNARTYANDIVRQIDSLIYSGVRAKDITVIGASKGGYIAQYVSTIAANNELSFVFIACFTEDDLEVIPEIEFCGNILTIYESSDPAGNSAKARLKQSSCSADHFKEIELNTGLGHGFLFKSMREWIEPSIKWASGEYESVDVLNLKYIS